MVRLKCTPISSRKKCKKEVGPVLRIAKFPTDIPAEREKIEKSEQAAISISWAFFFFFFFTKEHLLRKTFVR